MDVTQNTMQPYGHQRRHILHVDLKASGWKKPDDNSNAVSDPVYIKMPRSSSKSTVTVSGPVLMGWESGSKSTDKRQ